MAITQETNEQLVSLELKENEVLEILQDPKLFSKEELLAIATQLGCKLHYRKSAFLEVARQISIPTEEKSLKNLLGLIQTEVRIQIAIQLFAWAIRNNKLTDLSEEVQQKINL